MSKDDDRVSAETVAQLVLMLKHKIQTRDWQMLFSIISKSASSVSLNKPHSRKSYAGNTMWPMSSIDITFSLDGQSLSIRLQKSPKP